MQELLLERESRFADIERERTVRFATESTLEGMSAAELAAGYLKDAEDAAVLTRQAELAQSRAKQVSGATSGIFLPIARLIISEYVLDAVFLANLHNNCKLKTEMMMLSTMNRNPPAAPALHTASGKDRMPPPRIVFIRENTATASLLNRLRSSKGGIRESGRAFSKLLNPPLEFGSRSSLSIAS